MSILIKGMEMPTSCLRGECPIAGEYCGLWEEKHWKSPDEPYRKRHPKCPLVPVPPHGRLIDADEFVKRHKDWYCVNCERRKNSNGRFVYEIGDAPCRACDIGDMIDAVDDAPTIIEAEGAE